MIPKKLVDEINRWISEGRYGNLQINFAGGKILNVNRVESIKIDMIVSNDTHITSSLSKEVLPK
jgi:hypothetical protein